MKQSRFPIFRTNLTEIMKNEGLNTTEFAEKIGLSRKNLGFYLNGDRIPDALTLRQICEKCSVSADWLLGLSLEQNPDSSIQGVCSYTGLSGQSVTKIPDLLPGLRDIADELISHPSFYEMLHSVSKAWLLYTEYAENEQRIEQIVEQADGEVVAAQEYLREHFFDSVPYDEASELYFENAKSIFGRIVRHIECDPAK